MATQLKAVEQAPDNLRIWNLVSKTDPKYTKKVNQRGGFTAIAAQYQIMRATETFGPLGEGWGYVCGAPIFAGIMIMVPVTLWHGTPENSFGPIYGCAEMLGNRPDHDAPKKAMTDAITKGLSQLGFNADVFLGLFDDNKYVAAVTEEFSEPKREVGCEGTTPRKKAEPLTGPCKTRAEAKAKYGEFVRDLHACGDLDTLDCLLITEKDFLEQVKREMPLLLHGDDGELLGLAKEVKRMRAELEQGAANEPIDYTRAG